MHHFVSPIHLNVCFGDEIVGNRSTRSKSTQRKGRTYSMDLGIEPDSFLLWGNSATHLANIASCWDKKGFRTFGDV